MFHNLTHAKEQDGFIKFLSHSLIHNNTEGIKEWVKDKLLSKDTQASKSTREAFFEAERILMDSYIKAGRADRVIALVDAINGNNNQLLRKYQCDLLLLSLKEQKHVLHDNPEQLNALTGFLNIESDKLKEEHKQEILDEVQTYLSDLKKVQEFCQQGIEK